MKLGILIFSFFLAACARDENKSLYTFYTYKPDWNATQGLAAKWAFDVANKKSEYAEFIFDKTSGEAVGFRQTCEENLDATENAVIIDDGTGNIQIDLSSDRLPVMNQVKPGLQTNLNAADFASFSQSNGKTSRIELMQAPGYSRCH